LVFKRILDGYSSVKNIVRKGFGLDQMTTMLRVTIAILTIVNGEEVCNKA
jgi:hypothetical protein